MTIADNELRSRRMVLGAGLGALVATAASALGRPQAVQAGHGDVHLGGGNSAATMTWIEKTTSGSAAFRAHSLTNGNGLYGSSKSGQGVVGISESGGGVYGQSQTAQGVYGSSLQQNGVFGTGDTGVGGKGRSTGVKGTTTGQKGPDRAGVLGIAAASGSADAVGVWGRSSNGSAVYGETKIGDGLYGVASGASGYALRGSGRVRFDKVSGLATIPAGDRYVTVTPGVLVTDNSFVLLTPKANLGDAAVWFTTDPAAKTITIHTSVAVRVATDVAWLLIG